MHIGNLQCVTPVELIFLVGLPDSAQTCGYVFQTQSELFLPAQPAEAL